MTAADVIACAAWIFGTLGLAAAGIVCAAVAIFWRRLNRKMRRDHMTEYRVAPQWMQEGNR